MDRGLGSPVSEWRQDAPGACHFEWLQVADGDRNSAAASNMPIRKM